MKKIVSTRFAHNDLWARISTLARKSKRSHVAVAYLGPTAAELLPLKKGDFLVVDMSTRAAKSSQTDPREVRKFKKKGVEVYSCQNLHAKVFVFDNQAVVGSANVSQRSKNFLCEAGIVTTDPIVVDTARKFVESIDSEEVTWNRIKQCEAIYNPPRYGTGGGTGAVKPRSTMAWCRKVLAEIAPRSVKVGFKSGDYYIDLACESVHRIYLRPSDDFEEDARFLLELYPGDTATQAAPFYERVDISSFLALQGKDWEIKPNFHFGFMQSNLCRCKSPMNLRSYLKFWQQRRMPIGVVWRNRGDFRKHFERLLNARLISKTDMPQLIEAFTKSHRDRLSIRPGAMMTYEWLWPKKLPEPRNFAKIVRAKINQALNTLGETFVPMLDRQ
jgi:hypothetical protein